MLDTIQENGGKIARACAMAFASMTMLLIAHFMLEKHEFWRTMFHEIGFALMVSLIIWGLFEAQLRQEADVAWDERIRRVADNVFLAILRKDIPKALMHEANSLVLDARILRKNFCVTYSLRDGTFDLGPSKGECVLVDAVMEFTMENISASEVDWDVCVALPNPVHSDLKEACQVHSMDVRGGRKHRLDRDTAERQFRQQLSDNAVTHARYKLGQVSLAPNEVCQFSASYTMAKEAEDSELLASWFPADGLKVTIIDRGPTSIRKIFASSVHRLDLHQVAPQSSANGMAKIYTIPGYLLPHQGILIWWKRADAAGPATTPNVADAEV